MPKIPKPLSCTAILLTIFIAQASHTSAHNVVDFGASGDGKMTDSTSAFLKAWEAACQSDESPAQMVIPSGTFLVSSIKFSGPCKNRVEFVIDGTLVAPKSYKSLGKSDFWILFCNINGLSITGGVIDAKGTSLWSCRKGHNDNCPHGARSLKFESCNDVSVSGLKSVDSQRIHISIEDCNNMKLEKLTIIAPGTSPNTDGIHIESSQGIEVTSSSIMTGDDCISIGKGASHLMIDQIQCGPGHGISIGSLAKEYNEDGVENVTVRNSIFTETTNGVRIKSWERSCRGYVKNVIFDSIIMQGVKNPIIIDQNYCPDHKQCPKQNSSVKVSQITYKNITGTSATEEAVSFRCSSKTPCEEIELEDIDLHCDSSVEKPASSYCENAQGVSKGSVMPESCL